MTPERIFAIANGMAALSWLLLAVLPRQRWTALVTSRIVPMLFASAYVAIMASKWGTSEGGFSTLAAVSSLFGSRWLMLAGWLHYLAFDLLVGGWEVRDAHARAIPHLAVVPCLVLTFMLGPAGWLVYRGLRLAYRR